MEADIMRIRAIYPSINKIFTFGEDKCNTYGELLSIHTLTLNVNCKNVNNRFTYIVIQSINRLMNTLRLHVLINV